MLVLCALPLARLALEAVAPQGRLSADAFASVFADPSTWTATRHSLVTAFGGTALAVVIGTVVALAVSLDRHPRPQRVRVLLRCAAAARAAGRGAGVAAAFGPASPLLKMLGIAPALGQRNPLYSAGGIMLVLGVQYSPLVFLTVRAGLRSLPQELIDAARAGGARPATVLRTIVLPLMTPPLLAGVALCFVSCLGNFGIPAVLGIPGNYLVLPTLIYQRLAGLGPGVLPEVAVLSMVVGTSRSPVSWCRTCSCVAAISERGPPR